MEVVMADFLGWAGGGSLPEAKALTQMLQVVPEESSGWKMQQAPQPKDLEDGW